MGRKKTAITEKPIEEPPAIEPIAPVAEAPIEAVNSAPTVKKPRKPKVLSVVIPPPEIKEKAVMLPEEEIKKKPATAKKPRVKKETPPAIVVSPVDDKKEKELEKLKIKRELAEYKQSLALLKIQQDKEKARVSLELQQMKHQKDLDKLRNKQQKTMEASARPTRRKNKVVESDSEPELQPDTDDDDDDIVSELEIRKPKPVAKPVPAPVIKTSTPVIPPPVSQPQRPRHPANILASFGF